MKGRRKITKSHQRCPTCGGVVRPVYKDLLDKETGKKVGDIKVADCLMCLIEEQQRLQRLGLKPKPIDL